MLNYPSGEMDVATVSELENRVRELSGDVEGERLVTRRVYEQAVRNGDQLLALRNEAVALTARTDHVGQRGRPRQRNAAQPWRSARFIDPGYRPVAERRY